MTEKVKISIWDQFINSMYKPSKFIDMAKAKSSSFAAYFLFLNFIVFAAICIVPAAGTLISVGGFENFFLNRIPEFTITDGILDMESPIEISNSGTLFIVDTKTENLAETIDLSEYGAAIIINSDEIVFDYKFMKINYSILDVVGEGNFDNTILLGLIPSCCFTLCILAIMEFIIISLYFLFNTVLFSVFGIGLSKSNGSNMKYKEIFKICFYAETISFLLWAINSSIGNLVSQTLVIVISTFITAVFMITGISVEKKDRNDNKKNNFFGL